MNTDKLRLIFLMSAMRFKLVMDLSNIYVKDICFEYLHYRILKYYSNVSHEMSRLISILRKTMLLQGKSRDRGRDGLGIIEDCVLCVKWYLRQSVLCKIFN